MPLTIWSAIAFWSWRSAPCCSRKSVENDVTYSKCKCWVTWRHDLFHLHPVLFQMHPASSHFVVLLKWNISKCKTKSLENLNWTEFFFQGGVTIARSCTIVHRSYFEQSLWIATLARRAEWKFQKYPCLAGSWHKEILAELKRERGICVQYLRLSQPTRHNLTTRLLSPLFPPVLMPHESSSSPSPWISHTSW